MKLAIFAHFDKSNSIRLYVIYYLEQLKAICDSIIFVSTSVLNEQECAKLVNLCDRIIIRQNVGHDFCSYKVGIDAISNLDNCDELILCNDSCFGPLFPLKFIYDKLTKQQADFWGMSMNARPQLHIQSYFIGFNKKVIQSQPFQNFWQQLKALDNKDQIVFDYEVGLSQQLIDAGFIAIAVLPISGIRINLFQLLARRLQIFIKELDNKNSRYSWKNLFEPIDRIDKTITLFDLIIKNYSFPFLKKSLFKDKWVDKEEVYRIIDQVTQYDINLIKEVIND